MTKYRELRERTGLSAYGFAKELLYRRGTHPQTWYGYEQGRRVPQNQELENAIIQLLADKLGVSFNEILLELRGKEEERDLILS
jgi:transcriptional regulator with XRE-family HTH domain